MKRDVMVAFVAALLCIVTGPARAQYDAGATLGLGQGALLNNAVIGSNVMGDVIAGQGRRRSGAAPRLRRPEPPARTDPAVLTFTPSADVSEKVADRIARQFGGARVAEYRQALVRDGVLARFDALLRTYGYSSHDVADTFTAYMVASWEVVNGRDTDAYRSGVDHVRRRMRDALLATPRLAALSNAQKQEMAETFGYLAMIAAATRNQLERNGDTAGLARLQDGVNSTAKRMGVDLRAIDMTAQGFVTR